MLLGSKNLDSSCLQFFPLVPRIEWFMKRVQVQYDSTRSCRRRGLFILAQQKSWGERGRRACFWRGWSKTLQGKAYLRSSYPKRLLAGTRISSLDQFLTLLSCANFEEGKLSYTVLSHFQINMGDFLIGKHSTGDLQST